MAYRIDPDEVGDQVARFSAPSLHYWRVSLAKISEDPRRREGTYTERVVAIAPLPLRTLRYRITEEEFLSGERFYIFVAEFLPGYSIVYLVDDDPQDGWEGVVRIAFIRDRGGVWD